jgi:hypothetical protein
MSPDKLSFYRLFRYKVVKPESALEIFKCGLKCLGNQPVSQGVFGQVIQHGKGKNTDTHFQVAPPNYAEMLVHMQDGSLRSLGYDTLGKVCIYGKIFLINANLACEQRNAESGLQLIELSADELSELIANWVNRIEILLELPTAADTDIDQQEV